MHTTQGYYAVEFCNLMTKLDGTAEQFAALVTDIDMRLSKRLITIAAKDAHDGSTFRFLQTLEADSEWLLRVTMLREDLEPSYSLRFHNMKIKNHDVALGSSVNQTLFNAFGLTYDKPPVSHTLQLTFGTYEIEN